MTRDRYDIMPIFGVRPAGVAFDVLERLGSPAIAEAARRVDALARAADAAADDALARIATELADQRTLRSRLEQKVKKRAAMGADRVAAHPWLAPYDDAVAAHRAAAGELEQAIDGEYRRLHDVLLREAARELPDFLAIESEAFADEIERLVGADASAAHASKDRQKDRSLALYLQRVCAKNDTVSRFGPAVWGAIVPGDGVAMRPRAGIAQRRVELERWVVKGLIDTLNADPDVKPEALPRLHPHGRVEGDTFVRLDEDRAIALSAAERAAVARCDGRTPAHALAEPAVLAGLVERGVLRWEIEIMARDTSPLASLRADVDAWREGPVRDRWRARLDALAALVQRFATDTSAPGRRAIVGELRAHLEDIGVEKRAGGRTLYIARNPINENCLQHGEFTIGARSLDAMIDDAWPWFQLFGDAVAFAAARVYRRLHEVIVTAPRRNGVLDYSTLVRVARQQGLGIDDEALHEQVGGEAFREIKREWSELLAHRDDAHEWLLTPEECGFLRRRHTFPLGGELTYPSADLQVAAASVEDAEAGRLQWLVAELHFCPALLQHVFYWSCPDKPALHRAMHQSHAGRPFVLRDAGAGIPVHVSAEAVMAAMPQPTYAGSGRPKPAWRSVPPADAEVVVDEERCDVRLRARGSGEDLGSIVRNPRMINGLHPFFPFERAPHEPRLRIGNVIVQREAWHVESAAFGERPAGVSGAFISALERVRADRGIPRWVFVRPTPGVLASGPWSRDKDNKPLYVDLESVVFLDILERRLRKYGALIFTEMLPTPDQLVWRLPDGRFTFEVRTNIVPGERA